METILSGLLARAAGKPTVDFAFPTTNHHVDSILADENIRRELPPSPTDVGVLSDSSVDGAVFDGDIRFTDTQSSEDYPSYVCLYGSPGYSSSPTYVRGDCYSLTPPKSPSLGTASRSGNIKAGVGKSPRCLAFSIDAIVGSADDATSGPSTSVYDEPAKIFSSFSTTKEQMEHQCTFLSMVPENYHQNISTGSERDQLVYMVPKNYHHNISTGSELDQCMHWCHVCDDFCSDQSDAGIHQNTHFMNGETCRLQRNIFQRFGNVTCHFQTGYTNKVKCGLCEKIVTYCFFSRHLRCHEGHVCDICDKEFFSPSRLRDHVNTHYGYKAHVCTICNDEFSDRRDLSVHARKHKPRIHQCCFCSKSFRTRHACVIHQMTHTGSRPYACVVPGCFKSFTQSVKLQLHLNSHKNSEFP